jgi:protein-S-isoprenylcysteine O-methyltransferase Ste14
MDKKLLKDAMIKFVSGVILLGVLLFLPAWDIKWRNGWLLMAILFVPMFAAGIIMYRKAPDLLRSRLNAKEKQSEQKDVISYSGIMFLAMPLVLGSWPSFIIMLVYIPIIVKRIKNEEQVLEEELKGYREYKEKVKYRLIPYIW